MLSNKILREMSKPVLHMLLEHLDALLSNSKNAIATQAPSSTSVTSTLTMEAMLFFLTKKCFNTHIFLLKCNQVMMDLTAHNISIVPNIRNNVSVLLRNIEMNSVREL